MSTAVRLLRPCECRLFEEVIRLGRCASRTVGFLPAGAFEDYLWRDGILVALDGGVIGYVLSGISRERVRVAQLVVARSSRGSGVARRLMEGLMAHRWSCYAMLLTCRADFEASTLWPSFGFEVIGERPGRAGRLVLWWRRLGAAGMFESDTATSSIDR